MVPQMENSEEIICRFCQCTVERTNYDVIDNDAKNILTTILPNLLINKEEQAVMCHTCSVKVFAAFEFKTQCLKAEEIFKTGKVLPLDLMAFYKEGRNEHLNCINDQKVCRICMHLPNTKCTPFGYAQSEMLQMFIPEVNLGLTKDPVVCEGCLESLITHTGFMKTCLVMGKQIKTESDSSFGANFYRSSGLRVEREVVEVKQCLELENDIKLDHKDGFESVPEFFEQQIKQESVDIKFEEENQQGSTRPENECHAAEVKYETKNAELCQVTESVQRHADQDRKCLIEKSKLKEATIKRYQCNECSYEASLARNLKYHKLIHEDPSKTQRFACNQCSYQTPYRHRMTRHKLIHADLSTVRTFKCSECAYETVHKSSLKLHNSVKHTDPSQIVMHKCDQCPFQALHKTVLDKHKVKHADPAERELLKCNVCLYQAFHIQNLIRHKQRHVGPYRMEKLGCDKCSYETYHGHFLKRHRMKHADSDLFKCDHCLYQTKYHSSLMRHKKKHADPSQVEMYKCDKCSYQAIHKDYLKQHKVSHIDPSEREAFQCDECPFQTRFKFYLKRHKLQHVEGKPFRCGDCPYESKCKRNFQMHKWRHALSSDVEKFKCKTKYKGKLTRHVLNHGDSSQVQVYRSVENILDTSLIGRMTSKLSQLLQKTK